MPPTVGVKGIPLTTDVKHTLKFQYVVFELMRRQFVCPVQISNGVSDTALMKVLDNKEYKDRMEMNCQYFHQMKHIESYESMMMK